MPDSTAPREFVSTTWYNSFIAGTTSPTKSLSATAIALPDTTVAKVATTGTSTAELDLYSTQNMVCLEGGTFVMGCMEESGDCWENERPAHVTVVKGFYLSKYEVTQSLWYKVMGNNPSKLGDCAGCPVESVTWDEAQTFIARLNHLTGKNYRLPTEAEWEYAAREGGKNVRFGNGTNTAISEGINFNAQSAIKPNHTVGGHFRQTTLPVGSLAPNNVGLYDMSGNVWEWCSDNYQPYCAPEVTNNMLSTAFVATTPPPSTAVAPSKMRAIRGGSWKNAAPFCRTTARGKEDQQKANMFIGFRLALDK